MQAKERANIPDFVIDAVRAEFKKNRKEASDVNRERVREYLHKLDKMYKHARPKPIKFSRFYEHAPLIVERLTGRSPPLLTAEQESIMRWIFYMLEPAFDAVPDHIRGDRKNFLHYSYVIYKLCELLGYRELLPNLTLLKSKPRLRQHDMIWCSMMNFLVLPYYPTV